MIVWFWFDNKITQHTKTLSEKICWNIFKTLNIFEIIEKYVRKQTKNCPFLGSIHQRPYKILSEAKIKNPQIYSKTLTLLQNKTSLPPKTIINNSVNSVRLMLLSSHFQCFYNPVVLLLIVTARWPVTFVRIARIHPMPAPGHCGQGLVPWSFLLGGGGRLLRN